MLGQLRVAGFSLFTVFRVLGRFLSQKSGEGVREGVGSLGKSTVTASGSLSLTVAGLEQKGEGCVERKKKEKEGV